MKHTQEQKNRAVEQIAKYDFEFLRERYADENPKFATQFDESVGELKKFFVLTLEIEGPMAAMSHAVDALWHTFILHSPQYAMFCEDVFGEYLHHQPRSKAIPVPISAISNFYKEYPKQFGQMPSIWFTDIPSAHHAAVARGEVPAVVQTLQWSGWPGWGTNVDRFSKLYRSA